MSMGWTTRERSSARRSQRQKIPSLAYVQLGPQNGGFLINVSEGGTNFQGIEPLEAEQVLRVKFRLPGTTSSVEATTQVAWLNDTRKGGGLRFTELSDSTREAIKQWVSRQAIVAETQQDTQVSGLTRERENTVGAVLPAPPHVSINSKISQALAEAAKTNQEATHEEPPALPSVASVRIQEAVPPYPQVTAEPPAPPPAIFTEAESPEFTKAEVAELETTPAGPQIQATAHLTPVEIPPAYIAPHAVVASEVQRIDQPRAPRMQSAQMQPAFAQTPVSAPAQSQLGPATGQPATAQAVTQQPASGQPAMMRAAVAQPVAAFNDSIPMAIEARYGFLETVPRIAWLIGAVVALAAIFVVFRGYRSSSASSSATPIASKPLGLQLQRSGSDWRVSWNRDAAVVNSAMGGHLLITEGETRKDLSLDANELRSGSIMYTPVTGDAVLQLTITTANAALPISESVRIIGSVPQVEAKEKSASPLSALFHSQPRSARETNGDAYSSAPPVNSSPERNTVALKMAHPRLPPSSQPSGGIGAAGSNGNSQAADPGAPIQAPAERLDAGTRLPVIGFGRSQPPVPAAPAPPGVFEPAKLVSSKEPIYPALAAALEFSGPVELHFVIRADGSVANVEAKKGNPVFIPPAIEAVKAWRYKPATRGGVPIESEASTVIHFQRR